MTNFNELLLPLNALAHEAALRIMTVYDGGYVVDYKDDSSPITEADRRAHEIITQGLYSLTPDLPVLSEENSEHADVAQRRQWSRYWLVDPLDGTKEFVQKNGEFTVNIALIDNGFPVLGVVHLPARDRRYWGSVTQGAWRQDNSDEPLKLQVTVPALRPLRVMGSRSHASQDMGAYLAKWGPYQLTNAGSSLKFCAVAEGSADLYPRLGTTCFWDTAAAQCVVEAAGGAVVDLNGQRLRYDPGTDLRNPFFIALGDLSLLSSVS